ncbi:hypothetical protein AVP42_02568 [Agromyces sp. NDB4Y10]|nr:hypothetical protein AVP42_02568 [Agromyces sp. NDB4Y10]
MRGERGSYDPRSFRPQWEPHSTLLNLRLSIVGGTAVNLLRAPQITLVACYTGTPMGYGGFA